MHRKRGTAATVAPAAVAHTPSHPITSLRASPPVAAKTAIATAAIQNLLGGEEAMGCCRRPQIMADAAHAILTSTSRENTGNFYVDENVLRQHGVTDFAAYAMTPDAELLPDFFL